MQYRRLLAGAALGAIVVICATAARAETPLERGTYLMRSIVACGNCHTPRGADFKPLNDQELAGGFVIDAPVFHAVAPNITPDKETGIGGWTEVQIIDAIRNGKRPDGTIIGPPMPIAFYRGMSDADVRAIVAYLRSVKPIRNKVEKSTYKIPLPPSYGPPVTHVADVPRGNKLAYGHYLASGLGHCLDCHTPLLPTGQNDMSRLGAGGNELPGPGNSVVMSSNLTPGNPTGIASWTDTQIKAAIRTGHRPDGTPLTGPMAFAWYQNISDADLSVLVAYLRILKPVKTN
ncbi:MAG TPA: c-type cytochrome [Stellaceae bacterium]|nr:c-type cytochrome [Stellaceae bacterium]